MHKQERRLSLAKDLACAACRMQNAQRAACRQTRRMHVLHVSPHSIYYRKILAFWVLSRVHYTVQVLRTQYTLILLAEAFDTV